MSGENGEGILPTAEIKPQKIGGVAEAKELVQPTRELEGIYTEQRPTIKALYHNVDQWHGSGRYKTNENGEIIDILDGVAKAAAINPHKDGWDTSLGDVETTSTSGIRPYAAGYADMHQREGEELDYRDSRTNPTWILKTVGKVSVLNPVGAISLAKNWRQLKSKVRGGDAAEWIARKTGNTRIDGSQKARDFLHSRSSIPGNYSILWGIKAGAFEPIKTAKFVERTEKRADVPISLDSITHVEVPLAHIPDTQQVFDEQGINIPIIPRELGERYSSEFNDRELITGDGFKEGEYPLPKDVPSRSKLERFVPKKEWFTSPKQADSFYHGIDHLTRVLVLQETLTSLLIESGQLQPEQVDREALRWSAMAHDIKRHSDYMGKGHGQAAANWVLQLLPHDMPSQTRNKIFRIVAAHDQEIKPTSDIATELAIFKDADALDRIRLEQKLPPVLTPNMVRRKIGLDPSRLRFQASHQIIPLANELFRVSRYNKEGKEQDSGEAVLSAAAQMKLIAA